MVHDPNDHHNNTPNPEADRRRAQPTSRSRWRSQLWQWSLGLGLLGSGTLVIAGVWLSNYVRNDLAPLVAQQLSKTLQRPVEVGPVSRFGLSHLQFAESTVPATATDTDSLKIPTLTVRFNPLQTLRSRTLRLHITAHDPLLYVEQAADGSWVATQVQLSDKQGPIKIEVASVRLDNATAIAIPRSAEGLLGSPVELQGIEGQVNLNAAAEQIRLDLAGALEPGATFSVQGQTDFKLQALDANIQGKTLPLPLLQGLIANPYPLPLSLSSGTASTDLQLTLTQGKLTALQGNLQFQDLAAQAPNLSVPLTQGEGRLVLKNEQVIVDRLSAQAGNLTAVVRGALDWQAQTLNLKTEVAAVDLPQTLQTFAPDLLETLPVEVAGQVAARLAIGGTFAQPTLAGTLTTPKPLQIRGDQPLPIAGAVTLALDLGGTLAQPTLAGTLTTPQPLQIRRSQSVPIEGGVTLALTLGGTLAQPTLDGALNAPEGLKVDQLDLASLSTRFALSNLPTPANPSRRPSLRLQETAIAPRSGGRIRGGGTVTLGADPALDLDFSGADLPLADLAQAYGRTLPIALGSVAIQTQIRGTLAQPQALLQFQALEAAYPLQGRAQLVGNTINLENAVVSVAGGTLRAQGRQTAAGWQLQLNASRLQPRLLDLPIAGLVDGIFNLSGPANTFDLTALRAQGEVTLSEGLSLIRSPLTADLAWNGQAIAVRRAVAEGFQGQGLINVALPGSGQAAGITGLDLAVKLANYNLAELPIALPPAIALQGRTTFTGQLQGTPTAPQLRGDLVLADLAINQALFSPQLTGRLEQGSQGLSLNLAGQNEAIELDLDRQYQPQYAYFRRGTGQARATRQNQTLQVDLQQFPLNSFGLEAPPGFSHLGQHLLNSWVSGNAQVNLDSLDAVGSLRLDDPRRYGQNLDGSVPPAETLQTLFGGETQFRFADNILSLSEGSFDLGTSRFNFDGRGILAANPQFKLDVNLEQGQIRDFLRALQWFDLVDVAQGLKAPVYDTAQALGSIAVGNGQTPLGQQLQRFSEIKAQVAQTVEQRQEQAKLPSLRELEGAFNGNLSLSGSAAEGLTAQFGFGGRDWQWGKYNFQNIALSGDFKDGQVTLQPVLLESDDMELRFAGTIGGNQQSGQFSVRQLPVAFVRQFVDLPVDIEGQFNLQASVGGSIKDPQILGDLNLVNGTLNQVPLATRETAFSYLGGRLLFGGVLEVDENAETPVTIEGEIPYALPFSEVKPDSDEIAINLNVKNEGLALLNLISQNNLTWLGGQGEVNLSVGGTVQEPIAEGLVTLNGANVTAKALPEGDTITDLRGQIRFIRDRLQVENLVGQFSEGQVTAAGILPLATPFATDDPDRETPLAVSFQNVNLNLPEVYQGGAGGDVFVIGSALNPRLTGTVQLRDGGVNIPDPATAALRRLRQSAQGDTLTPANTLAISPITFDNLILQLQENVSVSSPPIFSFQAEGDLTINGGLGDLQPDGIIRVTRGQVNLFTTNLTLARRRENVAIFRPENGLNPTLDVQLLASVTEVSNQLPTAGPISQTEILDNPISGFNELQTIRIQASIEGSADNILQNLTLTSRPARSQAELYALMGGGFVNTLGQGGDSTLALANLAGSALINNLQSAINNVLSGPVDFRLFPTIVDANDTKEQADNEANTDETSNTLALGAELGINLTNSLSFSVLRLLTLDLPTRFNVRYQLNDNWQLRGASDFQGDNRMVVEYEARF